VRIRFETQPALVSRGCQDRRQLFRLRKKGPAARLDKVPWRSYGLMNRPVSAQGRRPAINALATAGDAPSISAKPCFSRHLGPGYGSAAQGGARTTPWSAPLRRKPF
jgi:hypothetical protein